MKKSLLLFALTLLSTLTVSAYDAKIDGIYYTLITKAKQAEVTSGDTKYTGSVTIPESFTYNGVTYSVTSIGNYAFSYCSGLTSVTIPNSVTSIGSSAFSYCSGLTSVTIPNSVTSIESWAFAGCSGLTSITIPNSVTSIGELAFYSCSKLTSVTIPNSVTSIGMGAFCNCSKLTSVTIGNSVTSIGSSAFSGCSGLTSITIPNSVTSIGSGAFAGCSGLTSIEIPNSVTSIGSSAFDSCSGLTSVTIPNSVKSIGYNAFDNCSGLTSITIGNSVTSIEAFAFYGCSGLTSITIPNSVTSIESWAFAGCSGLTSVHITDIAAWCKISYSDASSNPLYYAHHLFMNGKEITDLVIPNSVTSIRSNAFFGCSGLSAITIPNSVTSIGSNAFSGCSELADVYCYAKNVPSTQSDAFKDSYVDYATLYVPEASVAVYKAAEPWSGFGTIKTLSGETPPTPETQKCSTPTISYENGKLTFSCATEGATCQYSITDTDIKAGSGNEVQLTTTYKVTVYATKDGYENSDVATKDINVGGGASGIRGDVNNDGTVNMPDAMFIVNKILKGKFPDEE